MALKSKTLIIQNLQGIGDTMWFVRHVQSIAAATPEKCVTVLTRPRSMADKILAADPAVEAVLWLDIKGGQHDGFFGTLRLANMLKQNKFDTAWILHSRSLRYAAACRLAGIKNIYGPGIGVQKHLLSKSPMLTKGEQTLHPIRRGTLLLDHHGLKISPNPAPLVLDQKAVTYIHERFKEAKKPWIGLGIASSEAHKKWDWQNYVALGKSLHEKLGATIFVVGGPQEVEEGKKIYDALQEANIPVETATDCSIQESLSLLSKLDFIVGNDTGILHAAPMVGTRGLVLLGHTQVPIHHVSEVEGLHAGGDAIANSGPNAINDLSTVKVLKKLETLGWLKSL